MGDQETLSAGREPDRDPRRLPSRTVVAVSCLVVAVVAVAAWAGGSWHSEGQASQQASRQVAVEFVLQTAQVNQQQDQAGTPVTPPAWTAEVTGVLVNSGPSSVVVQRVTWAGQTTTGPYSLRPQDASPVLRLSTVIDCPSGTTRVPMPAPSIRVVTAANTVSTQPSVISNGEMWDEAVTQACTATPPPPEDLLDTGPLVSYLPSASALTVLVDIRNPGSAAAKAFPRIIAEGFHVVAVPDSVTIGPGQSVREVFRITVEDCNGARNGGIDGLNINPGDDGAVGASNDLVRQLDRLATRMCSRK
jgi:Tfp pilus assembly protein PilV